MSQVFEITPRLQRLSLPQPASRPLTKHAPSPAKSGFASLPVATADGSLVLTLGALTRLVPEWWDLWRRSPSATPFQSPAWLMSWWQIFRPGDLFVVAVRHAGELVGLAPLYREIGEEGARLRALGSGFSDYHDVLIDPRYREEVAAAITRTLLNYSELWDALSLEHLAPEGQGLNLPAPAGFADRVAAQRAIPILDLARLPQGNAAEPDGEFLIVTGDAFTADLLLEALVELNGEGGEGSHLLADEAARSFHRQALPRLQAAGLARLYGLERDSRIVGVYYGLVHAGRTYGYLNAFEPGSESAGDILFGHAIREAAREGSTAFEFLRGPVPAILAGHAAERRTQSRTLVRAAH